MKRTTALVLLFICILLAIAVAFIAVNLSQPRELSGPLGASVTTPANLVEHYMTVIKPGMSRVQVRLTVTQATNLCIDNQIHLQGDESVYARDLFGFRGSTNEATRGLIVQYVMIENTFVVTSVTKTDESMSVANAELMECPSPAKGTVVAP